MSAFEIRDCFYLDGAPFQIISGYIHYFRVPPAYWDDRLKKLKATGCNTVETYIPWNLHEPRRGEFRFDGGLDVGAFLRLAQAIRFETEGRAQETVALLDEPGLGREE